MVVLKRFILICLLIFHACYGYAADPHWVDDNGTEVVWANCQSASPLSGSSACTLATANTSADDDDVVYLRAGTYTITGNGIDPINSGSSGHVVTFSGYQDEVVTITGASGIIGRNSRAIYLHNDSYIKVTGIQGTNIREAFLIEGGGHNEISYCSFVGRNHYDDIFYAGTATANSSTALIDLESDDFRTYSISVCPVINVTDGSSVRAEITPEEHQIDHYLGNTLSGGDDNTWQIGDTYKVTNVQDYDPGFASIQDDSTHNWIHHCIIHGSGALTPIGDEGVLFTISFTSNTSWVCSNNTIEYNHVYHGGHHVFAVNSGFYNVIRKNYFHNEGWYEDADECNICSVGDNGVCGYRVVYSAGDETHVGQTLYEDNFIGYGAQYGRSHPGSGGPGGGMSLGNDENIVRYNAFVGSHQYGLSLYTSLGANSQGDNNRVYNNTLFENGYNWLSYEINGTDTALEGDDLWRTNMLLSTEEVVGNVIKNNITHGAWSLQNKRAQSLYYPNLVAGTTNNKTNNTILNNYVTDETYDGSSSPIIDTNDPLFVNESIPDDSAAIIAAWSSYSVTSPDLSLQADSPAVDTGSYLTNVATEDTGSGTSLIVDDARYFQDGTWGSDLASLDADYICVGATVFDADCMQISAVDYDTNTIIVADFARADGEYVWLYKKSDGTIVLAGSAPDMGAFERIQAAATGTVTANITESQVVSGGRTIVITVSGMAWVATVGADNAITTTLIAGIDSNKAEATGWDAVVKAGLTYEAVTRTDDYTVTILLPAFASYAISESETITVTIPAAATESGEVIVATPTVLIGNEEVAAETRNMVYNAQGPAIVYNAQGITISAP